MSSKEILEIDPFVIESSDRCNQCYLCNQANWDSCCKVDENINNLILHVDVVHNNERMIKCNYHLPFGGEHYCTCPARKYIYNKYKM